MRLTSALIAGCVAATSAFLVPPTIPEDFKDLRFKGGPPKFVKDFFHTLLEGKTTEINLACPDCLFASSTEDESLVWTGDIENAIHLEFSTHGSRLNLNGHPLLPLEEAQKAQSTMIKAYQIREDTNTRSADVLLNYAMEIMPPMASPHKDGVSLIPVEFTVLALNGLPVKVDTISLKLIQTPTKELVIVNHEEIPFEETPGADTCEGSRPWTLCRLRAIIMARMRSLAESTKKKSDHVQGWVKHHCGGRRPHPSVANGEQPHKHHGHHHGHHGPHRYHRIGHMLHQTFRFFIIPALLGVIGGLIASAIGMMVGRAIVFLWFTTYRRGQRGPLRIVQTEILVEPEEKDELLAEEGLPQYEDVPPYPVDGIETSDSAREKQ